VKDDLKREMFLRHGDWDRPSRWKRTKLHRSARHALRETDRFEAYRMPTQEDQEQASTLTDSEILLEAYWEDYMALLEPREESHWSERIDGDYWGLPRASRPVA
jgi:hypothetical protein